MGEAYAASAAVRARTTEAFMMIFVECYLELSQRTICLIKWFIGVVCCCDVEDDELMIIRFSL